MLAVLLFVVLPLVQAHMEMMFPLPFKSRFDIANSFSNDGIDYSMTTPLDQRGANYPCKGYHSTLAATPVKASLVAGGTLDVTLSGTATHNGGSCEFSVSYDQGKTFAVIHRVVGGCPLDAKIPVPVPSNLPASKKAIFAWTWVNHTGNRELYMNCAAVDIKNPNTNTKTYTAPSLFRVNTYSDGTCITGEGFDVQYPQVNKVNTRFQAGMSASNPVTQVANCPVELSKIITVTSDGTVPDAPPSKPSNSPAGPKTTSTTQAAKTTSSSQSTKKASSSSSSKRFTIVTTSAAKTSTTAVAPPRTTAVGSAPGCVPGTFKCSGDGYSWSQCSNGVWIAMGSTAKGMICRNGAHIRDPSYVPGKAN